MTDNRASIFGTEDNGGSKLDLGGFEPRKDSKPIRKDVAKAIAEESSFLSREPKNEQPAPRVLRKKVVRQDPLSARIQREHFELFYKIVNDTGKKNAEVLELAIEAYARELGIE